MPLETISTRTLPPGQSTGKLPAAGVSIARDTLLDVVCGLLAEPRNRLLTLVGPGGSGKTWLAAEVTRRLRHRLPGRTVFVRLDEVREPDELMQAIASELGAAPPGTVTRSIVDVASAVADRPILIVLDTVEHLTHAAPLLTDLVERCPEVTILVTSRRPLGLRVERAITVPPLTCPDPGEVTTVEALATSDAGKVFLATASAVAPSHPVSDAQAAAVASICHRLDGSPLAIRLAATQLPLLTPAEIDRRLDAPLDLFSDTAGDAPARQHSLRASIAWSHDLLGRDERASFRRLAVFAGSFPLLAAISVTGGTSEGEHATPMSHLRTLVDNSLVQRIDTSDSTEPRFRLGAAERAFACEQLDRAGERHCVTRRLARWMLALAERRTPDASHLDEELWLAHIAAEDANMAAVRGWIVETGNWRLGLRLATALYAFWLTRGCHDDEREWLRSMLDIVPAEVPREYSARRARIMHLLGLLSHTSGAFDEAETAYRSALTLRRDLGDRAAETATMHNLGMLSASRGDLQRAAARFRESSENARAIGDHETLAMSLCYLAHVLNGLGQRPAAWESMQEAGNILRDHGSTRLLAFHAYCLGDILWSKGMLRDAREQLQRCLEQSIQIGDTHSQAAAALSLALVDRDEKRLADAAHHCLDAFRCLAIRQDRRVLAEALHICAVVATATGEWPLAARLIGAGDAILDSLAAVTLPRQQDERARALRAARNAIGARATTAALDIGRSMRTTDAIGAATTFASALVDSGRIPAGTGSNPVALTPREHDVLELLVRGLTNREIGNLLELSHRTVATHVTNLLGKLDVTTRAAAAGEAVRLELVPSGTSSESAT